MNIRLLRLASLTILISLGFTSSISAALIAYDGFDYGGTGGDLSGENGGTGWAGAYTDSGNSTLYDTTGLTYGSLSTTGGSSRTDDSSGSTTISFRALSSTISSGETWVSFLFQRNTTDVSNFGGLSLYDDSLSAEVAMARRNDNFYVFDPTDDIGEDTVIDGDSNNVVIAQDTTYLVVAQILWNATGDETLNLYLNPTIGGASPTTSLGTASISTPINNFESIRIAGQNAVDYNFDEVRVGTTFADVTPVPEPSAALLIGFGSLLLLIRRRR